MRSRLRRLRTLLVLGLGAAITTVGLIAYATDALRNVELQTVDARFSIRGTEPPPRDLVIVAIDDVTFSDLNTQWPFPRSLHADVIDSIAAERPKLIAYDVQFSEPSHPQDQDLALAKALADARPRVVLATTEVDDRGRGRFLGSAGVPPKIGATLASGLFPNDPGDVIRRIDYSVDGMKSFPVAGAETAADRRVDPHALGDDGAWIDYYGPPHTIKTISFSRVVRKRLPPRFFRDKLVVIGASSPSLQDVHPTSTSGDEAMSGAEIEANAIATVRRGFPLRTAPPPVDLALIAVLGMVAPLASLRFSPLRALAIAFGTAGAFVVGTQLAFNAGTIVAFVYPAGVFVLVCIAVLTVLSLTSAVERAHVRDLFSRFVPEGVVDEVLSRTDDDLRLGGVLCEGTVMVCDLRGFTSFAESMLPNRVIDVLNRYLTEMSDGILGHGGTLLAYMGDGILAVFGAPIQQSDHADRAVAAAREILTDRLPRFNRWLRSEGLEQDFRIGIGLNSGLLMAGNVGSERRVEYTAIGDTTNTASRLEGMTKRTSHQLLIADSTRLALKSPAADIVYVGEFEVRGRQAQVKLWSLRSADGAPERDPSTGEADVLSSPGLT